ncbi:muconolactone Delta-isomerase family protein [Polluticoccus soli]|uniref:muconolactone Delta-isomerase family protein n=1 Tax=Polluticoccus soli TaxID=3034150 RepID=UPI0023E116F9|nr:muconolactone Delta-isomerase family protein [Flavipsychrobacter sp. JY13-12]
MSAYLFEIELQTITEELSNMIPEHREHIAQLFSQGRLFSYSVSQNRKMVWCVVNAEDEQEAMEMVARFPLYKFFTDVSCHPLLFHNTLPASLPDISLN